VIHRGVFRVPRCHDACGGASSLLRRTAEKGRRAGPDGKTAVSDGRQVHCRTRKKSRACEGRLPRLEIERVLRETDDLVIAKRVYRFCTKQYPGRIVLLYDQGRIITRSDRSELK
jgi:hypothetical protein